MRIGDMGFWPSAVAGGRFFIRGKMKAEKGKIFGGARGAVRRADVGSELSAASGRSSEVSEWPRSKF